MSEAPVIEYAFLDTEPLGGHEPLPNYHLLHTVLLWLVYHAVPQGLAQTIWPAGLVSAAAGALAVGLSFLLWRQLGIARTPALAAAGVAAVLPGLWYHSLIGEVFALQLALLLAFALAFLRGWVVGAALTLFLALLVTPSSILGSTLVVLAPLTRKRLLQACAVVAVAGVGYFAVFRALDADLLSLAAAVPEARPDRTLAFSVIMLVGLIVLNLNVLLWPCALGSRLLWRERPRLAGSLAVAVFPQLVYLATPERIFVELGSMLLPLFWSASLPVAYAVVRWRRVRRAWPWLLVGVVGTYLLVWMIPAHQRGLQRREAGVWLAGQRHGAATILGSGEAAVPVVLARHGPRVEVLSAHYYDVREPDVALLRRASLASAILVEPKKSPVRELLGHVPIRGFAVDEYDPRDHIQQGSLRKIFENPAVILYLWTADAGS